MPVDPYEIICEILGQPAYVMTNPANAEYQCPFINSTCVKRSQKYEGPYPVCSIFRHMKKGEKMEKEPIIVCPKRFYEADLFKDILAHAWTGPPPENPCFVHEITMEGVGKVDFVVADIDSESNEVRNFVSAELQAVDITGSVEPAYTSILLSTPLEKKPTSNFNYANVRKRLITQLINKGFFHHHWKTKIIAIVQSPIYENIKNAICFADTSISESNVLFIQYDIQEEEENDHKEYHVKFSSVTGTTHNALMMSALYSKVPSRDAFCQKILAQLRSSK